MCTATFGGVHWLSSNYSHYQQQSHALLSAIPPVSPSQFSGSQMPVPGSSTYPQLQSQDMSLISPSISKSVPLLQPSHLAHVPPPFLAPVNNGACPLTVTVLSPPSISHSISSPSRSFNPHSLQRRRPVDEQKKERERERGCLKTILWTLWMQFLVIHAVNSKGS